jgi:subtilase family serine protease
MKIKTKNNSILRAFLFFSLIFMFFLTSIHADTQIIKKTKLKKRQFKTLKSDLIVESLTHQPENMLTTDNQIFTAIVKNIGNATSQPCKLRFKIGGESSPPEYQIDALAPGGTRQWKRQAYLNRAGRYVIKGIVDCNDDVVESDEDNNEKSYNLTVQEPGKPDFTVVSIKIFRPHRADYPPSVSPYVNERINIEATVKNIGDATATYTYSFRIGGETTPSSSTIHNSRPGHEVKLNRTTQFSRRGRYRITVIVDPGNAVPEKLESNNTKIKHFRVRIR